MPRRLKPELIEQIRPLVRQGKKGLEIAQAMGLDERTAREYVRHLRAQQAGANGATPDPTPPAATLEDVCLDWIHLETPTQARERLNPAVVTAYAEAMAEGAHFPPVVLFLDDGGYKVGDGFHRIRAAQQVGFTTIKAEVRRGDWREALLYAASANQTHGLQRTNADKRRAVLILLQDEEWQTWSDREIARHCGVPHIFVRKLRQELSGNGFQMPEARQVRRGETVYEMDTSRIGRQEPIPTSVNGRSGGHEEEPLPGEAEDTPAKQRARESVHDLEPDPTPVGEPQAGEEHEDAGDGQADGFARYCTAWEDLSRAHAAWASHVRTDRRVAVGMVVRRAGVGIAGHIEALQETAASLQDFAAALQEASER